MRFYELYKKYNEQFNYLIIGFFTTLLSLFIYFISVHFFLDASNELELQCANVISWLVGVVFAYFTNKKIVFKSRTNEKLREFGKFFSSRIFTLILDAIIMFIFVSLLEYNDSIIKFISQVIVIIVNYILSKFIIFI